MTDRVDFETQLGERVRARAALASRPFDAAEIARKALVVNGRRRWTVRLDWPSTRPALSWLVVALLLAVALLGAVAGVGALLREQDQVPAHMTVVEHVIEAMNHRDSESLRSSFTAEGIVEFPGVDGRAGREGDVYRHDQPVYEDQPVEGWMRILDTWGMQARLGSCRTHLESTISCAVRTRWNVLQVEIGEEWTFDFDGARVRRLDMMARVDPDPSNRVLPLGLSDIDDAQRPASLQHWEEWLRETHPEQADRLLPKGPDLFAHSYFRFGLDASPDEIGASIREYLESPDPLVGTYVCSEDGNPDSAHTWDVREDGTIIRGPDETGQAQAAGTWSRSNGRFFTDFQGGMTWFTIDGDRLVGPAGAWTCTPGNSR